MQYQSEQKSIFKMPNLVLDAFVVETLGRTPWPEDARLFQQYEGEQVLMPEFASCLSVKAFLNMCGLKYNTELRQNAEFMSPTGKLPFLVLGQMIFADFESLVTVATAKGRNLSKDLTDEQRAVMKKCIDLINNKMTHVLEYVLWCNEENLKAITLPRYGTPYKWPLRVVLPLKKKWAVQKELKSLGWANKTTEEVLQEMNECLKTLSEQLANQQYFFGNKPTELDALVFGYLYTILTTTLTSTELVDLLASYGNLRDFCLRVHDSYFTNSKSHS